MRKFKFKEVPKDLDVKSVMKKPVTVHAAQVNESFTVDTLEGTSYEGQPGDWLMVGIDGETYPCAKAIFEKTYDFVEEEEFTHGSPNSAE